MNYKKGFTLVELLVVLLVISIILYLAATNILTVGKNMKQSLYENKIKLIEKAAELFGQSNKDRIKRILGIECNSNIAGKCECTAGNCYYIYNVTLRELINEGFYKKENTGNSCKVLDPRNMTCMDNYVIKLRIGVNNKKVIANFDDTTIDTSSGDYIIRLNKGYATSIEKNELKCTPNDSNTCTVTFPNITAGSEFTKLGWSQNINSTSAEVRDKGVLTVNRYNNGKTYYAILKDEKKPVCTFSQVPANIGYGKKNITLTCTENGSGFQDNQNLTVNNITSSNNAAAQITNISTIKNTKNEKSYKIEINAKSFGTVNFSVAAGSLKDNSGNGNDLTKSSSVVISEFQFVERWEIGKVNRSDVIAYLYKNKDVLGTNDGLYTLKISGTGQMLDFTNVKNTGGGWIYAPWYESYKSKISNVEIDDGVTNVGANAFLEHSALTRVKLSTKTTVIEEKSFRECSNLSGINIPASVELIQPYAFYKDNNLKSLTFENNSKIKTLKNYSFYNCNIENLSLPASLETIGSSSFENNINLKTLTFENNSHLKTIELSAFEQTKVGSLNIPASVESIGGYAFHRDKVENNNGYHCDNMLKTLTFENNSKLKTIGTDAFYCSGITTLTLPNSVEKIFDSAFANSTIRTLNLSSSIKEIGHSAFENNDIRYLTIPSSLNIIKSWAFASNQYLSSVTFQENSNLQSIGDYAFYYNSFSNFNIPGKVGTIGTNAFYGTNITTLFIPANVQKLDDAIVHGPYLRNINVDAKSPYFTSVDGVLYDKNKTRLINVPDAYGLRSSLLDLPETITKNDYNALDGWLWESSSDGFTIDIPKNMTAIKVYYFSVKSFTINGKSTNNTDNSVYSVKDGVLFSKDSKKLIRYAPLQYNSNYTVPSTTISIETDAFSGNIVTPTVTVPNSVKEIGYSSFHSHVLHNGIKTINLFTNDDVSIKSDSFIPTYYSNYGEENAIKSRTINVKTEALKSRLEKELYHDDPKIKYYINVKK